MMIIYLLLFLPCLLIFLILLWNTIAGVTGISKETNKTTTPKLLSNMILVIFPVVALLSFCLFPYYEVGFQSITGFDLFTDNYFVLTANSDERYVLSFACKIAFVLFCICCINPILAYDDTYGHHILLGVMLFFAPLLAYFTFSFKGLVSHYGSGYKVYIICSVLYLIFAFLSKLIDKQGTAKEASDNKPKGNYCSHCGAKLEDGQNFCPQCGTKR